MISSDEPAIAEEGHIAELPLDEMNAKDEDDGFETHSNDDDFEEDYNDEDDAY